jgi:adenosylcobinamide-GDP ribazoletransferase
VGRAATLAPPDAATLVLLPVVGAVLGGIAGAAAWGASFVAPPPFVPALAFALVIFLSGAIHVDGFLDCCDAAFASAPPEHRLEILKDPRHGTFAVAGMAVLAVLWLAALASLPAARLPALLAFAGASARWAVVLNALFVPYARGGAVTRAFESRPSAWVLALEGLLLAACAFALAPWLWALLALAAALALGLGAWLKRAFGGGLVGDAYGFAIVCVEVALLAGIACMQRIA